jgi:multidrug transporter EmrE-like cation transporter
MPAILFILGHTLFNTIAITCLKVSAQASTAWIFIIWQAVGNFSSFIGALSYTMSMRSLPLHVAYPLTQGLSVLGVTLISSQIIFNEYIALHQWCGIFLVIMGIFLISMPSRAKTTLAVETSNETASPIGKTNGTEEF